MSTDFPRTRAATSVDQACHALADDLIDAGLELPSVYLLTGARLRCHAARGYFQVVDGFSPGTGVLGTAVQTGRSVLVEDAAERPDFIHAIPGLRAAACAPVWLDEQVVGAVNVESRSALPPGTLQVVEAAAVLLGDQLAAVGGLPQPSLAQRLGQTSVELTAAGTAAELEKRVVRAAADLSGMRTAALIHLGVHGAVLTTVEGPLSPTLRRWGLAELDELASWVTAGTSSHFPGGLANPAQHHFLLDAGIRSISVHPLVAGGGTTGVLVLVSDVPTAHAPTVVDCLELLASQTAALLRLFTALGDVSRRADLDELTGLANRSQYSRSVAAARAGLPAGPEAVGVLLLDLDDFKHVNDSLGHHAGDRLLQEVAHRLRAVLRAEDSVCRLGGDEFAIVLPQTVRAAAEATAARLLDALADVVVIDGAVLHVSASIGVALSSTAADAPDQLLRAADLAMYLAKQRGKGRYAVFEPQMQLAALDRLALESDLRRAVHDEALSLAYQPIVELATGRLAGVEALIRWDDRPQGPVAPGEFIPVAEESGLIVALGAWALRQACTQLKRWDDEGGPSDLIMAVNVSTRQLERPGLLDIIDGCLAGGGDPSRLVLEITETALTRDAAGALDCLTQLRERGVQVAVDDFGTGYSSLDRLRSAPITRLKIDRRFVAEIDGVNDQVPVVDATMLLSRGFGLACVAEGVETVAQLDYLRAAGCAYAQGFLLARPVPAPQVPVHGRPPWADLFAVDVGSA